MRSLRQQQPSAMRSSGKFTCVFVKKEIDRAAASTVNGIGPDEAILGLYISSCNQDSSSWIDVELPTEQSKR